MMTEPLTSSQVLHFLVKEVKMCAHLKNIKKVLPLPALELVPGAPFYFVGLMNAAGKSIPVIDLALRLGLTRSEKYSINTPILLCEQNNKAAGFLVDSILELTPVEIIQLQMQDEFKQFASFYLGSVINGLSPSLLINIDNLLNFDLAGGNTSYAR